MSPVRQGTRALHTGNSTSERKDKPPWEAPDPTVTAYVTEPGIVCRPGNHVILDGELVKVHPDWWFPSPSDEKAVARAVDLCGRCPATDRCLQLAVLVGEDAGVWGGHMFEREGKRGRSKGSPDPKTPLYDQQGRRVG